MKIFSFVVFTTITYFSLVCTRNPFLFLNEQQSTNKYVDTLELKGISICNETGAMLAVIMHKRELFIVATGDFIEKWRINKIDKGYVILVDASGNEKRLELD